MAYLNEDVLKALQQESILDPQQRWMRSMIGDSTLIPSGNKPKSVVIREDMRSVFNTEGIFPTLEGTLEILKKLEEAGVQEVEIGFPHTKEHNEFCRTAKKAGCRLKLGAHINARAKDYKHNIDLAVENGYDMVNFVAGGDKIRGISEHGVAGDEQKTLDQVAEAIIYAKSKGMKRSIIWAPTTPPGREGAIPAKLDQMGLEADDGELDQIYQKMIEGCRANVSGYVADTEMEEIIHIVLGK